MKKFLIAVLAAVLAAAALPAGDLEDVKALVLKDWQLAAEGKFSECLALRAPDFTDTNDGITADYEQTRWQLVSLDGKHPEEFLLFLATLKFEGAKIPPETMATIREEARKPEFIKHYETACPQFASLIKNEAAFQLKTLKIVDAEVDGDSASVVARYERREGKSAVPRLQNLSLRRIDGAWKIGRIVDKSDETSPNKEKMR